MNRGRGRGGRTPSTPSSGQYWRPVRNRAAATSNEVSLVSDSGNSNHARHGKPEQKEVLELTANVSRVQMVDEDTKHFEKMNCFRGRGGRTPSTPFRGQVWGQVSNPAAAITNEVSPASDSGNSDHAHRGMPEQKEVLELITTNVSRVQLVDEDTEHLEDNRVSPSNMITPSRDDVKASGMSHSSNYSRKSGLSQDFMSPEAGSNISVDGHAKPFDICSSSSGSVLKPSLLSKNREKRNQMKRSKEGVSADILRPGMVLLKSYLSIDDQVKIVKICRELGKGPGGFYQPEYRDGAKLNLRMMCLGKNWDPETSHYGDMRPIDGAIPPEIPDEFNQFVENALKDCHDAIKKQTREPNVEKALPWMKPDICLVNFYSSNGRLGLHQDRDESKSSLKKGLPVVSFSIGDTAEFLYRDQRDVENANKVSLKSGDVLVFGGESRHIFHGVADIVKETAPNSMKNESKLLPGRLNLTFRQY